MTTDALVEANGIGRFSAFGSIADTIQFLQGKIADVKALAVASETLLKGIPASDFFHFLVDANVTSNYGLPAIEGGGDEAVYVNTVVSLTRDNAAATSELVAVASGASLTEMISSIYAKVVPAGRQTAEGLAYLVRDEAIQFYKDAAQARGLSGDLGAATVAFGALMKILVDTKVGAGDAASDLARSLADGVWQLPNVSLNPLALETVDGAAYDGDDAAAFANVPAPPPAIPQAALDWAIV